VLLLRRWETARLRPRFHRGFEYATHEKPSTCPTYEVQERISPMSGAELPVTAFITSTTVPTGPDPGPAPVTSAQLPVTAFITSTTVPTGPDPGPAPVRFASRKGLPLGFLHAAPRSHSLFSPRSYPESVPRALGRGRPVSGQTELGEGQSSLHEKELLREELLHVAHFSPILFQVVQRIFLLVRVSQQLEVLVPVRGVLIPRARMGSKSPSLRGIEIAANS